MLSPTIAPDFPRPDYAAWLGSSNGIAQQFLAFASRPDVVSLAGGLPAAECYPTEAIARASQHVLATRGASVLEYGDVEGLSDLRALIAERVAKETGGQFSAANVLLTTGSSQALDLLGKVLIDSGDVILTQSPTYLGALDAWRARSPVYEKLDWHGGLASNREALRRAKFVYTVPNYSNPTGVLVGEQQRAEVLAQVLEAGTWLVEDDPYKTISFDGQSVPSILSLDVKTRTGLYDGPVIALGTLSKSIAPGLRVGWMVAAPLMIKKLALAKQASILSCSALNQAIAYELLRDGLEATLAKTVVPLYRERRDSLCAAAQTYLSEWFDWEVPVGGMFVWMRAKNHAIDTDALYAFAVEERVAFVPSSVFDCTGSDRFGMRLNFTRNAPDILLEGVRRLGKAVARYLDAQGHQAT